MSYEVEVFETIELPPASRLLRVIVGDRAFLLGNFYGDLAVGAEDSEGRRQSLVSFDNTTGRIVMGSGITLDNFDLDDKGRIKICPWLAK